MRLKQFVWVFALAALALSSCGGAQQSKETPTQAQAEPEKPKAVPPKNEAHKVVLDMVAANGGTDAFYGLKDVAYKYTYKNPDGSVDISFEKYIFEGEYSYAEYSTRGVFVFPDTDGSVTMGYDGKSTWCILNGEEVTDSAAVKMADFLRKTNYYWFAMMFKLADPGLNYELLDPQTIDGQAYDVVKVTFNDGVGDVKDVYVLYVNKATQLVDQFLFTVMDFGMENPLLMKVEYQDVAGVKVPKYRKYTQSNWNAEVLADVWVENYFEEVKFNNGFTPAQLSKPQI